MKEKISNYDVFKQSALQRFLTYEQQPLIDRLELDSDENYIYIIVCGRKQRLGRRETVLETAVEQEDSMDACWKEASCNEVLTICDLLCHTEEPIILTGRFRSLEGLNRVKGSSSTILGEGFHAKTEAFFDAHPELLKKACEELGGIPMGKGDVAYRIPLFGPIDVLLGFYSSDDEFPPKLTIYFDEDICRYMHYETLYYAANIVLERLKERMGGA